MKYKLTMNTTKKLMELSVADLKRECEERDLESSGKQGVLQNRLRSYLQRAGENPETYLFEAPRSVEQLVASLQMELAAQREEMKRGQEKMKSGQSL